ncbi:hypothetical protein PLCT2_01664 [Planctomycetaceae bacterium]|nr:hypothetical protein PLCT2_01664 [Planctomycetaceae bacterium]
MGEIIFYKERNAQGLMLGEMDDAPGQAFNFMRGGPVPNDQASSMRLKNVRAGCIIKLFDHPRGSLTADWCQIEVIKSAPDYVVPSFEQRYADEFVRVAFFHKNGLDGRVSRIELD